MYPKWQKTIRQAQHNSNVELESQRQDMEMAEAGAELYAAKGLTRVLFLLGIIDDAVAITTNRYEIDGYKFQLGERSSGDVTQRVMFWEGEQTSRFGNAKYREIFFALHVSKPLPNELADQFGEPCEYLEKRIDVNRSWEYAHIEMADILDKLDETYRKILAKHADHQLEGVYEIKGAFTTQPAEDKQTITDMIRQIVREELYGNQINEY